MTDATHPKRENLQSTAPGPTVSILLPAYNHAAFIAESIHSALSQTYTDFELIVMDDGSTDATRDVVQAFTDSRVIYRYQANRGVAAALNAAYRLGRGKYLAILNDDDLWTKDRLAIQVRVLDENPGLGLVYGRAQVIDAQGRPQPQFLSVAGKYPGDMLRSLLHEDCIAPLTVLLRRECIERAGPWDEALPGVDDWDLWLRIACYYPIQYVDAVVGYYRIHPHNYSRIYSEHFERYQERRVQVLDKFFDRSECASQVSDMKRRAYRNLYILIGLQWFSARAWGKARNSFRAAFQAAPTITTLARIFASLGLHILSRSSWGSRLVTSYAAWRIRGRAERQANPVPPPKESGELVE